METDLASKNTEKTIILKTNPNCIITLKKSTPQEIHDKLNWYLANDQQPFAEQNWIKKESSFIETFIWIVSIDAKFINCSNNNPSILLEINMIQKPFIYTKYLCFGNKITNIEALQFIDAPNLQKLEIGYQNCFYTLKALKKCKFDSIIELIAADTSVVNVNDLGLIRCKMPKLYMLYVQFGNSKINRPRNYKSEEFIDVVKLETTHLKYLLLPKFRLNSKSFDKIVNKKWNHIEFDDLNI